LPDSLSQVFQHDTLKGNAQQCQSQDAGERCPAKSFSYHVTDVPLTEIGSETSGGASCAKQLQIDSDEYEHIDEKEESKGRVVALALGYCSNHAQDKYEDDRDDVKRALSNKVRLSLQQSIHRVDNREERSQGKEPTVASVVVALEVGPIVERLRQEQDGKQEGNNRTQEDEKKEEERPLLGDLPTVENPPVQEEPEEHVHSPECLDPIEAYAPPQLEDPTQTGKDTRESERDDNRCEKDDVFELTHAISKTSLGLPNGTPAEQGTAAACGAPAPAICPALHHL
jgi:hypothetical protein